jgi:hypothetical protein
MATRGRHAYLRQEVTLVGLGTPTFEKAIDVIGDIFGIFDRNIGNGTLLPFELTRKGLSILHTSNRLLTPRKDAPNMRGTPFANGVDPRGILTAIVGEGEYVHGEDNEVRYFILHGDGQGARK